MLELFILTSRFLVVIIKSKKFIANYKTETDAQLYKAFQKDKKEQSKDIHVIKYLW